MSSKEQTHDNKKAKTKQQALKPTTENVDTLLQQQIQPVTNLQRARANPRSLSSKDILQLQRTIGNKALGQLFEQTGEISSAPVLSISETALGGTQQMVIQTMKGTLPKAKKGGWDVITFVNLMQEHGIRGMCNALSAAWLTQLIAPPSGDQLGVDSSNLEKVERLKTLLDLVIDHYNEYDSSMVTFGFLSYFRSNNLGPNWFDDFTEDNIDERFEDFKAFFHQWRGGNDAYSVQHKEIEGSYEYLAQNRLDDFINFEVLEPFFDYALPFEGVISFKAYQETKDGIALITGHEWTIRYSPTERKFEIFDQNAGLSQEEVTDQEDISEHLATHIWIRYIDFSFPDTNYAQIKLTLFRQEE